MVYSVLTEPVIPVLWLDGTNSAVGIREAFLRAHEIRDIQGETPLERYALLRLLIAFAMDMLHPKTSYDRRDLLDAGKFDQETFDQYTALCEKDGPRFDLFDRDHPFMQSKYDEKLDEKAEKSVANLFPSLPSGNNHMFIDHRFENEHYIKPDRALGALCAIYLFCAPAAHGYPSSINNKPPIYITIMGINLFETITENMIAIKEAGSIDYGLGLAPWRIENTVIPSKKFASVSLIEAYTWMPRRITLLCDDDGFIRRILYQQGHNFQGNDLWKDPHVPYVCVKDSYVPVRPVLGKQLWRDVASLTYSGDAAKIPFALYRLNQIMEDDELPNYIPVSMLGFILENGKYDIWYEDTLSIPKNILENEESAILLRNDVTLIEKTSTSLLTSIKKYVDQPRQKSQSIEHEIASQCQQHFLHAAHDLLFGSAMDEIISNVPEKQHAEHFCEAVKGLLQETIHQVLRASGTDAKAMMQQMEAEKWIWISWSKITEERMRAYAGS